MIKFCTRLWKPPLNSSLLDAAVAELCETARNRSQDRSSPLRFIFLRKEPETAIAPERPSSTSATASAIAVYATICPESDIRPICADSRRDRQTVWRVWWRIVKDVITIEGTHAAPGVHHVLGEAPYFPLTAYPLRPTWKSTQPRPQGP